MERETRSDVIGPWVALLGFFGGFGLTLISSYVIALTVLEGVCGGDTAGPALWSQTWSFCSFIGAPYGAPRTERVMLYIFLPVLVYTAGGIASVVARSKRVLLGGLILSATVALTQILIPSFLGH